MSVEIRKEKEEALEKAKQAADVAQKAAEEKGFEDESLNEAAEKAEQAVSDLEAEIAALPPESEEEEGQEEEDIDFEEEKKRLGVTPPGAQPPPKAGETELEKAKRSLHFVTKRVKELGGDPNEILGIKAPEAPPQGDTDPRYVTKEDVALDRIRKLAKTDAEADVIIHHYRNTIRLTGNTDQDIENAYLIAHKGKIKRSFSEVRRAAANMPPKGPQGGAGGRPGVESQQPALSRAEQATLLRRGFKKLADGSWEGKHYTLKYNKQAKKWDEIPKPKK